MENPFSSRKSAPTIKKAYQTSKKLRSSLCIRTTYDFCKSWKLKARKQTRAVIPPVQLPRRYEQQVSGFAQERHGNDLNICMNCFGGGVVIGGFISYEVLSYVLVYNINIHIYSTSTVMPRNYEPQVWDILTYFSRCQKWIDVRIYLMVFHNFLALFYIYT